MPPSELKPVESLLLVKEGGRSGNGGEDQKSAVNVDNQKGMLVGARKKGPDHEGSDHIMWECKVSVTWPLKETRGTSTSSRKMI